jgi:hypothetical protein
MAAEQAAQRFQVGAAVVALAPEASPGYFRTANEILGTDGFRFSGWSLDLGRELL